jgi:hypothetical protein
MKRLLNILILVIAFTATGCEMSNQYGQCKGFADKDEESPKLNYEVSVWNVVWAAIFSETLLWPILTGAFWLWCPTSKKQ